MLGRFKVLREKTTLILGAGASFDAGMPLGNDLAEQIAAITYFEFDYSLTKGDHRFLGVLQAAFPETDELNVHLKICRKISDGVKLWRSIDNYVDSNSSETKVATIAKLAIAELILRSEKRSRLFFQDLHTARFDTNKLGKTWYDEFANILFQSVPLARISEELEKLCVISFNYDRCFQQAMALWISSAYHISLLEAYDLVRKIRIVFPYGTVGQLPNSQRGDGLHFGSEPNRTSLKDISTSIRTYSESTTDESYFRQLSEAYGFGRNIIFLGCAYHPQNLKLLRSQGNTFERFVVGTALGISLEGCKRIGESVIDSFFELSNSVQQRQSTINAVLGNQVRLHNDFDCQRLLKDYRQALIN